MVEYVSVPVPVDRVEEVYRLLGQGPEIAPGVRISGIDPEALGHHRRGLEGQRLEIGRRYDISFSRRQGRTGQETGRFTGIVTPRSGPYRATFRDIQPVEGFAIGKRSRRGIPKWKSITLSEITRAVPA